MAGGIVQPEEQEGKSARIAFAMSNAVFLIVELSLEQAFNDGCCLKATTVVLPRFWFGAKLGI
jgi:hypothetical protein